LQTTTRKPASIQHRESHFGSLWEDGESKTTRQIGSQWIKKATHPSLRVPSIITGEPNYILNPNHPDFLKIEITDPRIFRFDQRLFP
jgi:RES domain-containing protein